MIRKLVSLLVVLVLLSAGVQSVSASTPEQLNVMTRNMDAGSDFWYVLTADPTNPSAILVAITQTYQEMLASNIALRADGIAAEIQRQHPKMVALQEVTTLSSGPYGATELTVVVSGLDSLMTALGNRGLHYKAILVQKHAEISLPALDATYQNLIQVGLTDYDAVLVRADLPAAELKVVGKQAGHFSAAATLNFTVAGQSIPFLRGWIAVDVKVRGKNYRLVTTHLETFSPDYQAAQTNELLNGPLSTDLPLILAGDLNSDAHAPQLGEWPGLRDPDQRGVRGYLERDPSERCRNYLATLPGGFRNRSFDTAENRSDSVQGQWHRSATNCADGSQSAEWTVVVGPCRGRRRF